MKHKLFLIISLFFLLSACERDSKAERTIPLSEDGLFSAAVSEQYALIGKASGPAELWQLAPKHLLHTWQHTDENDGIIKVAISGNEHYAMTAERNSIAWWRISDGTLLNVWSLPNIHSLSLSYNGQFALIGLDDKAIYFTLKDGKTLYAFEHENTVLATALSKGGRYALTGSVDNTAKLWNLSNGKLKHTWQHSNQLATVALSEDDQYALTNAALSQTQIWKTRNGKLAKELGPKLLTLSAAQFSANGKYVTTGRTSQRIDLWDVKTGHLLKYWRPKKDEKWRPSAATILALAFNHNDKKITSIAANGYLQRWKK